MAKIESPTHTESHAALPSAHSAISIISATVVAPITTPRFGSVSPNFGFCDAIESTSIRRAARASTRLKAFDALR